MEYVTLSNGVKMPILGYGVYQVTPEECERCVLDALKAGYRSIDTAQVYFNEEQVGSAIQKSGVPREEIFLTTKVWLEHYGYEQTLASVKESMRKLQTDYLDLLLLHQPFGDAYGAWRALEELYEAGKLRAIGISNYYPDRMVEFANFNRIKPMVNQIETHIFDQQKVSKEWADKYGIQLEAWAPFGEGRGGTFENPVIADIAAKHGKTPAQVMLRWHIQRGIVVIPKSTHYERMVENFNVFDFALTDEDMTAIAALDTATSSFFSHQDPATIEWLAQMVEQR
jgi:2,5-diketo-D-gluconate reductase A